MVTPEAWWAGAFPNISAPSGAEGALLSGMPKPMP